MRYDELPGFGRVSLEDSWVLGIDVAGDELRVRLDAVLLEGHPLYTEPGRRERHCYREGVIVFAGLCRCSGRLDLVPSADPSGERDLGHVGELVGARRDASDPLEDEGVVWRLSGSWGTLSIVSEPPAMVIAQGRGAGSVNARSRGAAHAPSRHLSSPPGARPASITASAPSGANVPGQVTPRPPKNPPSAPPVRTPPAPLHFEPEQERSERVAALFASAPEGTVRLGQGVPEAWIAQAEHDLGFPLPESYKWWLRTYGTGTIGADEVFGLRAEHVDDIPSGDIRYHFRNDLRSGLQPAHLLTFFSPAADGAFAFDTSCPDRDGEYPVVAQALNWARYAHDFWDFLEKFVRPMAA